MPRPEPRGSDAAPLTVQTVAKQKSTLREYAEALLVALLLALVIRTFVVQAFKIPSGSMLPTLQVGDHILVNKFIYGPRLEIPLTQVSLGRLPGLRKPKPGDVVVWDNLTPHQSEEAVEAVEGAGARVVPLPPWSPDLTPIEEMFSKVKNAMRSAAARTTEAVYAAFGSALHDVTPENIAGWFQDRAAYAMQL